MKRSNRWNVLQRMTLVVLALLVGGAVIVLILTANHRHLQNAKKPIKPEIAKTEPRSLVFDMPPGWQEVPGQLSHTYRSARPGAGFFQLSLHPPLAKNIDGPGAEKALADLLGEMKSEMAFGKRLEIGYVPAHDGVLAFARYQSPEHGVLGFWLLPSVDSVFATYIDGGSPASKSDIREVQKALQSARYE